MNLNLRILFVRSINQNIQPNEYRAIFTILMAPSVLYLVLKSDRLKLISRGVIVFVFALGMFYNVKYIYNAFGVECEGLSCPFVPSTSLSKLHLPYVWRFLKLPELNETPSKIF